ncbi:V-type ATP synthase subunit E [Parachlamydia sp. AcF125]|uniref:V-type ATP synthase subunit E n=1 Tax=Parachlamydia sp. AcF125 TaxID=2795736 RepID=UPI001BC8CB5D|nr:V-type ATP synthase subunit E [Parachlamydia sp. AcF125]MBS4167480.1 V-type proton ATPase subunit E [Parachlamydia sp. AcF125]
MEKLEKGQDKIQKICDTLRRETLEPARQEAQKIITEAHAKAAKIIKEAEQQAVALHEQARKSIEQERHIFQSSLEQAARQGLESLRQSIEHKLFNEELERVLEKQTADPQLVVKVVNAVVEAVQKEGISSNLSVAISKQVSPEQVNALLLENVKNKLNEKGVVVGDFAGGAEIKLHGKRFTIDMTDQTLKELLARHARKDFRQLIFGIKGG